jgi:acetyl-CoA carboxylase biotin carboxyl carrier protein
MDDIKITIRTTIEGTATETTVQQMPAHNQQAMPVQCCASSGCRRHPVVEENKYITKVSNHWNFYRKPTQTNLFVEVGTTIEKVTFFV